MYSLMLSLALIAAPKTCIEPHRMNAFEEQGYKTCKVVYEECLQKTPKPGKFKPGKQPSKTELCQRAETRCINKAFKDWLPHELCKSAGTRFAFETCMAAAIEQADGKPATGPRAYLDGEVDENTPFCRKDN